MENEKNYLGSSFDSFLDEEGLLADAEALALKHVISWQLQQAMERSQLTKSEVAKRMHTSRAAFDRLLDPNNTSVTLKSIERAAVVLGKKVRLEFTDAVIG